jgi:protein-tyrosine-phosphatase
MAEAIARHNAADVIEPSSAGLVPFGQITSPTIKVLAENGVSAEGQYSKPLRQEDLSEVQLLVNMSGRSCVAALDGARLPIEDWDVGDPYGFNLAVYRKIRDEIETRIDDLAHRLRESKVMRNHQDDA